MSQAGKFIPGGAGRKSTTQPVPGVATPIRGPERPGGDPPKKGGRLLSKGRDITTKPVQKQQRLPILIMSSFVCCLLVSIAWYELGVLPARRALAIEQQKEAAAQQQLATAQAAIPKPATIAAKPDALPAVVTVNSNPAGTVTIGAVSLPTPATFDHVTAGKISLVVHSDGFDDYRQNLTVSADKPTDLGTVQLVQSLGNVVISSAQGNVSYTLTGPGGYTHQGQVPDKLSDLPAGTYQLSAHLDDWQIPPLTLVVQSHVTLQEKITFPYGSLSLTSTPAGATVRKGNVVLGQTPLSLSQIRPGAMDLSIDLPPYTVQRTSVTVPESGNASKQVSLEIGKDFIAACGMPMIWIPEGFWAGKYEVTQKVFEAVAKYNPSSFRKANRPVESVTWEQATAFCEKLNQFEDTAGKLPKGFHYTLPSESQWDTFSADANIDLAATSRTTTLSSTQDVGASEPNKYGLYDTIGNVWEWCTDAMDENGAHSLRGGSWLSSTENFPNAETRTAGAAKYSDRFTGFRVVLVPQ